MFCWFSSRKPKNTYQTENRRTNLKWSKKKLFLFFVFSLSSSHWLALCPKAPPFSAKKSLLPTPNICLPSSPSLSTHLFFIITTTIYYHLSLTITLIYHSATNFFFTVFQVVSGFWILHIVFNSVQYTLVITNLDVWSFQFVVYLVDNLIKSFKVLFLH